MARRNHPSQILARCSHRLRRACRTNEPQATSVVLFTLLNVAAWASAQPSPWYILAVAAAFWPCVAFLANLIDPLDA